GHEVGLFSSSVPAHPWYKSMPGIKVYAPAGGKEIKKVIREFHPDIVHAHYATRYGWIGARSGFHPFIISVWGSDVMSFPHRSLLHRLLLKHNLRKADRILATSEALSKAVSAFTDKKAEVLPFGIDTTVFVPASQPHQGLVIGTIKSLEEVYGIDTLLKGYALLRNKKPELDMKLHIIGRGTKEMEYKELARQLGIADEVVFTGWVEFEDTPRYYQEMDIFVNVSRREGFGVSVLEAQASGLPVIATGVGGLKEVTRPGISGLEVPPDDTQALLKALETLAENTSLRKQMGEEGRKFVLQDYNWERNLQRMEQIYESLIA
ncbi:MAG TPA: glycosyltransferase, partial [Bacteroidia bacterium]|nr:glycosyltransferase [Bacteroidia bacterium]